MSDKKLKAYQWDDEHEGTATIVWAESAGKAKAEIANDNDIAFTEAKVYRAPWADEYGDWDNVPPEVLLEHGWLLPCCRCGKYDFDDEGDENMIVVDGKVYCKECYEEVSEK